jgi:predicted Fe-Mo cluster-binding NifX family protein
MQGARKMRICIPVNEDKGLDSIVCGHFGSAPCFMIVDTDNLGLEPVVNNNAHHAHGMCQPLAAISGKNVEAIVVGGIGLGALNKLQAGGITVFKAQHNTFRETIDAVKKGSLSQVDAQGACGHHGRHGHGS